MAFSVLCILLFWHIPLFAAEAEMILPQPPIVLGEPFSISFLFYGASPDAVFWEGEGGNAGSRIISHLIEEAFPPSFSVETIKKSSAALPHKRGLGGRGRATVIEIVAIPREAGDFAIGPFFFKADGERAAFDAVNVSVEGPAFFAGQAGGILRLFWLVQEEPDAAFVLPSEASSLEAGKGALIVLMATAPAEGSISCPAPENALLEHGSLDLPALDLLMQTLEPEGLKAMAAYSWTPLFSGRQALPRASFFPAAGGQEYASEPAEAEVREPLPAQGAEESQDADPSQDARNSSQALPAQPPPHAKKPNALFPLAGDSRLEVALAEKASSLWDEGRHAEAAVMLRAAESAFPLKKRIAEMRRAADDALMAEWKPPAALERCIFFAPLVLLPSAAILIAILVISSLALGKRGERHASPFAKGKLILACAFFAALGIGIALYSHFTGGMEEAAASGGFLRRVPDADSAAVIALRPAAPLKIERRLQSWLYVKTLAGEFGWYPSSEIIVYKSGDLHEFR